MAIQKLVISFFVSGCLMSKGIVIDASTREYFRDFRARWKRINQFQLDEAKRKTPTQRYHDFLYLMSLAKQLNWQTSTPAEDEEARRRWQKIRQAYRG